MESLVEKAMVKEVRDLELSEEDGVKAGFFDDGS